jgi:hypothetical protein
VFNRPNEIRTLPDLPGASPANFLSPQFYVPEKIPVMAQHEVKLLQEASPAATGRLNEIETHLAARSQQLMWMHYCICVSRHYTKQVGTTGFWYSPLPLVLF